MYSSSTSTTTHSLLLLLLFSFLVLITTTTSDPIIGLDTFLNDQSRVDPQANKDSFQSLSSSVKKSLSSYHFPSLIPSLLSLSLSYNVHVRLVGNSFPPDSSSLISSFLSASHSSDNFHISSDPFHRLAVKHQLHLDVSLSPPSLVSSLSDALKSQIAAATSSLRSSILSLSYDPIDQIIRKDFEKEKPVQGVYVYLVSLGPQSKPYAYSYGHGESSPGFTKCLGTIWTGKERYVWIDLSAGPVDYGPGLSGDGVLPKGEFHPLAALHGSPKSQKALLAEMASLVYSAYQVLVVPSLRIPVLYENSLIVQFIHIHGSDNKDSAGLNWNFIEKTFLDEVKDGGLLLSDQSLRFKTYNVNYKQCSICSFAISRSLSSYTSRFLFDNYTLIASEYLDSKRLHQTLSDSAEEFRRVAGIPEEEDVARVLPVYVFDMDFNTQVFLDRYHQSVSFKDMVIAVRTTITQTVSDYSCNGRHVFVHARELERPLVGSILQSMWGVSPTHSVWSPRHNSTIVDYTWSVGQTPFGPFSEISSLSFVQKDAARRNVILTAMNYTISSALDILASMSAHGGDGKLLKQKKHVEFIQRWNLFKHKLDKTTSAMSHFDFEKAYYYLKSSDHDLFAMHTFVYNASQEIEASLVCFKDPPVPWGSMSLSAICVIALLYAYAKRDKLFKNKRKQF